MAAAGRPVHTRGSNYPPFSAAVFLYLQPIISIMFNKRVKIKALLENDATGYEATVMGWVRSFRNNQFIALNDGSTNNNIQILATLGQFDDALLKRITTGACIKATGNVIASLGKGQKVELQAATIEILGDSDAEKFPLQPKKHSLEFLREIAHLRFRTNTFGAIFRVRNTLAFAVHKFFNERGFVYMHTPIITGSDAEGAGEMFQVTTLPLDGTAPKNEDGSINFKEDFFWQKYQPYGERPVRRRAGGYGFQRYLYIRSNLPGREQQYHPSPGGVLDD
jgi:asparaginyl-tRNA synthetase